MTNITNEMSTLIAGFAKTNKIGRAKVETLINDVLALVPASGNSGAGRAPGEHALKFRAEVARFVGKTVTAKMVASELGIPPSHAINELARLARQGGATLAGKMDRPAGMRGPKENLYTVL